MGDRTAVTLPWLGTRPSHLLAAPFVGLSALWIQITGTWCNLECSHCLNSSGPREPWLRPLEGWPAEFAETIRSGWWTTCLENLPVKERVRGKF